MYLYVCSRPRGTKAQTWKTCRIIRPEQFCFSLMTKRSHQCHYRFYHVPFQNIRLFSPCLFQNVSVHGDQYGKSRSFDVFPIARLVPSNIMKAEVCSGVGWRKSFQRDVGLCLYDLRHISTLYSNCHLKNQKYHIIRKKVHCTAIYFCSFHITWHHFQLHQKYCRLLCIKASEAYYILLLLLQQQKLYTEKTLLIQLIC